MALPKINQQLKSFTQIPLPSGKNIGIHPWRVKEEKELLFATDSASPENIVNTQEEIIKFVKSCSDNEEVFDTLSNSDLIFLTAELRKLTKGAKIEYSYQCPHCKTRNEEEVNLRENVIVKPFNYEPIVIDNMIFTIKDVSYIDMNKIHLESNENISKYNHNYILHAIDTISVDGILYPSFTIEEISELIDNLESNQFDKLEESIEKNVSSVTLEQTFPCIRCSKDVVVDFGVLYDFFVF